MTTKHKKARNASARFENIVAAQRTSKRQQQNDFGFQLPPQPAATPPAAASTRTEGKHK